MKNFAWIFFALVMGAYIWVDYHEIITTRPIYSALVFGSGLVFALALIYFSRAWKNHR